MRAVEDDEQRKLLVGGEAVLGTRRHEDRHPLRERSGGAFDLERAGAVEHDVHLVLVVRLLPVGLGSDEHVDADFEPGRGVDDLIAAAACDERALRLVDIERVLEW